MGQRTKDDKDVPPEETARIAAFRRDIVRVFDKHRVSGVVVYARAYDVEDQGDEMSIHVAPDAVGAIGFFPLARPNEVPASQTPRMHCYANAMLVHRELESGRVEQLLVASSDQVIEDGRRAKEAWALQVEANEEAAEATKTPQATGSLPLSVVGRVVRRNDN